MRAAHERGTLKNEPQGKAPKLLISMREGATRRPSEIIGPKSAERPAGNRNIPDLPMRGLQIPQSRQSALTGFS